MTLTQLKAFLAAIELGSFTAAAHQLGTSQASTSELVSRLEDEVGLELFVRGGRRLTPTPAALELRHHAVKALNAVDEGLDAMHAMTSLTSGVCTFGVLRNAAYYNLADLAHRFHARYPGVQIRLTGINSALVAESVRNRELEAGLVVLPVDTDGLKVAPLFDDEVLYCSSSRPRSRGPVTMRELADASLVLYDAHVGWDDPTRRQLLERARRDHLTINASIEVENVETALGLVSRGAGDSFVSRSVVQSGGFPANVRTFPFAEPFAETVALIQREHQELSPATQRMVALARQSLRLHMSRRAAPEPFA